MAVGLFALDRPQQFRAGLVETAQPDQGAGQAVLRVEGESEAPAPDRRFVRVGRLIGQLGGGPDPGDLTFGDQARVAQLQQQFLQRPGFAIGVGLEVVRQLLAEGGQDGGQGLNQAAGGAVGVDRYANRLLIEPERQGGGLDAVQQQGVTR